MPTSVIVAVSALGAMLALETVILLLGLLANPQNLLSVAGAMAAGALIVWGMVVGHRLAWQWGRVLGIIAAVGYSIVGVLAFAAPPPKDQPEWAIRVTGVIFLFVATCLYIIFFALGQRSAKQFFNLQCPTCGTLTSKAADFFFNTAKCSKCGNTWS